jgi:phosphatidate phosphatase
MDQSPAESAGFCSRHCLVEVFDLPGFATTAALSILEGVLYAVLKVDPLYVPPNDALSDFPYPGADSVSTGAAVGFLFVINAAVIVGLFFLARSHPDHFRQFHIFRAIWALLSSWLLVLIITEFLKVYVGRPRPDIYARCGFNATYAQCRAVIGDAAVDAFKSWPSGHASNCMVAGTYAGLFFQYAVKIDQLWVALFGVAFLLYGFGVGASRIVDYRHHTDDVLAGLFVGWVGTYMVWIRERHRIFKQTGEVRESID